MNKNEFWSGLVLGGLLGVTFAMLLANQIDEVEDKVEASTGNITKKKDTEGKTSTPDKQGNKDGQNKKENKADKANKNNEKEDSQKNQDDGIVAKLLQTDMEEEESSDKDKEKGKERNQKNDEEKNNMTEAEVRNPKDEVKKKAEKEGQSISKETSGKLNFGKKIAQLEDALKKLREESIQ
ncbi:MAG: hypothetical protein ACOCRZ_01465 [Halothermotrichaceae bacterium]